jgi:DNA polymerase III subunit delta'
MGHEKAPPMIVLRDLNTISLPMPWHKQEWQQLVKQFEAGRLPHALLLFGRDNIGKSQLAFALARFLLCATPESSLNCGRCHACELSARANHGDFQWIEPTENSRIIKIDQIRDIVRFTSKTAGLGSRKVIVVTAAHTMNTHGFNALLKSLEEPAKDTYIILICSQTQGIPATIRSRCQLHPLATPSSDSCLEWLDSLTGDSERSRTLLALASGRPLIAKQLHLSDDAEAYVARRLAFDEMASGRLSVAQVAQLWIDCDTLEFLEYLVAHIQRKVVVLSSEQLKTKQLSAVFRLLEEIYQLQRALHSGANPNKHLLLLGLLSKYRRQLGASLPGDKILPAARGIGL